MSKFTKGPWKWWNSCSFKRLTAKVDGDILHAYVASDGHPCIEVSEANAHLIAAAPDLYITLQNLVKSVDKLRLRPTDIPDELIINLFKADKALAKANGE